MNLMRAKVQIFVSQKTFLNICFFSVFYKSKIFAFSSQTLKFQRFQPFQICTKVSQKCHTFKNRTEHTLKYHFNNQNFPSHIAAFDTKVPHFFGHYLDAL